MNYNLLKVRIPYVYGNPIRFNDPTGMIGEEDPPRKGSTPNNPIDIGEIKLTKM